MNEYWDLASCTWEERGRLACRLVSATSVGTANDDGCTAAGQFVRCLVLYVAERTRESEGLRVKVRVLLYWWIEGSRCMLRSVAVVVARCGVVALGRRSRRSRLLSLSLSRSLSVCLPTPHHYLPTTTATATAATARSPGLNHTQQQRRYHQLLTPSRVVSSSSSSLSHLASTRTRSIITVEHRRMASISSSSDVAAAPMPSLDFSLTPEAIADGTAAAVAECKAVHDAVAELPPSLVTLDNTLLPLARASAVFATRTYVR